MWLTARSRDLGNDHRDADKAYLKPNRLVQATPTPPCLLPAIHLHPSRGLCLHRTNNRGDWTIQRNRESSVLPEQAQESGAGRASLGGWERGGTRHGPGRSSRPAGQSLSKYGAHTVRTSEAADAQRRGSHSTPAGARWHRPCIQATHRALIKKSPPNFWC